MYHGLTDAKIAGGNTFVKASNTTLSINTIYTLSDGHLNFGIVVQLQTCFNKPNWICYGRGNKTGTSCTYNMNLW